MDDQLRNDAVSLLERLRDEAEREMGGSAKKRRVRVCEMLLERVAGAPPGPGFTMRDVELIRGLDHRHFGSYIDYADDGYANLADRIKQWVQAGVVL